jgi:type IV secretion system protein VirD4
LISCGTRLVPFDIPQLREIMSYDELELDRIGDRKTATFFIISDTDTTYNFIVALAFSQMFNLLCERADNKYGGRFAPSCASAVGRSCKHGEGAAT